MGDRGDFGGGGRERSRSRSRSRSRGGDRGGDRGDGGDRGGDRGDRGGDRGGGRENGVALRWNEKGFGFIKPDDGGEDIFCHFSGIDDGKCLMEGAKVEYRKTYDERKGKYRAEQVTGGSAEPEAGFGGGGFGGGGYGGGGGGYGGGGGNYGGGGGGYGGFGGGGGGGGDVRPGAS